MLRNFIKNVWKNKFAILDFIFTWLLPVAYVGTKVHYIEIDIAWKITIFGFMAIFVVFLAFRKKLQDYIFKKYGYKSVRDYAIKRPYGGLRALLLILVKHWKQGIALLVLWLLEKLASNAVDTWIIIMALGAIGSLFCFMHNLSRKEVITNEETIS